jgi:hypothetical protein
MPDKLKIIGAVSIAFLLFAASQSYARVWYVKQDGTGDAPTIQAAIDSATANDTVLVAPGTYTQRVIIVVKDSLTVMSEEGAEKTILHTSSSEIMWTAGTCLTIKGFMFEGSASGALGVTELLQGNDDVLIEENIFRNNRAGAISVTSIFPDMINRSSMSPYVVIRNNLIYSNGGGIHIAQWSGNVYICQNTISHNAPGQGVAAVDEWDCSNSIHHNIISYNEIGVDGFGYCASDFLCNDIFGNKSNVDPPPFGTNGNIDVDPQFCGVEPQVSGNYFLQSDSPCAPGKHPDGYPCGLIGARAVGCQDTAVERTTWGAIKAIYR